MYSCGGSRTVLSMAWVRGGGLAFPIAVIVAFASVCPLVDSPPAHGASGSAQVAKGKAKRSRACKKKRKRAIACGHRNGQRSLPGVPRTVTVTWDSAADIDLEIYDLRGRHAGLEGSAVANGIPGTTHSGNDIDGFGPETFTDPSGERVGYLVCYVSGPYANVTLIDSGLGGGRYTAGLGPSGSSPDGPRAYSKSVGWGYLPISAHC